MVMRDEMPSGWVRNPHPLRKPEPEEAAPEDNPLDQLCDRCQMPMWMCECEQSKGE